MTKKPALTAALAHELLLCKGSFDRFTALASLNILGRRDKLTKILCHDAYSRFLQHLHAFYEGIVELRVSKTKSQCGGYVDAMLKLEVERLMRGRAGAVRMGVAPKWDNSASYYEVPVPDEFPGDWRKVRNRTAHVKQERARDGNGVRLVDFYEKYHQFIMILFNQALFSWNIRDIDGFDWMDIESFDLSANRYAQGAIGVPEVAGGYRFSKGD